MGERISVKDMLCAAMHIGTCNNSFVTFTVVY